MATEQAHEQRTIRATVERCYEVVADFERYPEWARDVKEATVVERDDAGRGVLVDFRAGAMGHSVRYRLRYDHSEAPHRMAWVLEEGDIVRRLDGEYRFTAGTDDATTDVEYRLEVDLVVPLPGFVKRRAEGKIMSTALDELARRVGDDGG